jgi:hypothetical protein
MEMFKRAQNEILAEEIDALRAAFLDTLRAENHCDRRGCDRLGWASEKCGCVLEAKNKIAYWRLYLADEERQA